VESLDAFIIFRYECLERDLTVQKLIPRQPDRAEAAAVDPVQYHVSLVVELFSGKDHSSSQVNGTPVWPSDSVDSRLSSMPRSCWSGRGIPPLRMIGSSGRGRLAKSRRAPSTRVSSGRVRPTLRPPSGSLPKRASSEVNWLSPWLPRLTLGRGRVRSG